MSNLTYKNCKLLIDKNRYEYQDMLEKLDVFLLGNRIDRDQYIELTNLIESKK